MHKKCYEAFHKIFLKLLKIYGGGVEVSGGSNQLIFRRGRWEGREGEVAGTQDDTDAN